MSPFPNGHYGDISDLALDPFFGESQKCLVVVARRLLRFQLSVKIALAGVRIDAGIQLAELFDGRGCEVLDWGQGGQTGANLTSQAVRDRHRFAVHGR